MSTDDGLTLRSEGKRWNEDGEDAEDLLCSILFETWMGREQEELLIRKPKVPPKLEDDRPPASVQYYRDTIYYAFYGLAAAGLLIDELRERVAALERIHQLP